VSGRPETDVRIGVIGGSGLYDMEALRIFEERTVETPFGPPSDPFVIGELEGRRVAFLARHGKGHRLLPTELDYRANIFGFKLLGVERILAVGAVGSLKEAYPPGHVVVPDQFIDRTRHRADTFYGDGLVVHVSLADPVCPELTGWLAEAAGEAGADVHRGGTYVCMEGPQFSTRAESFLYRSWGADVIGMTNLQEAKLAREAEICYATLAMVTDYDCWHEEEEAVSVDAVLKILRRNSRTAQDVVRRVVARLPESRGDGCVCGEALATALITDPAHVPRETVEKLRPLVGKYFPERS